MPEAHELLSDTVVEMDGGGRGVLEVDSGCRGRGPAGAHMGQLGPMGCNHWATALEGRGHPEVGGDLERQTGEQSGLRQSLQEEFEGSELGTEKGSLSFPKERALRPAEGR